MASQNEYIKIGKFKINKKLIFAGVIVLVLVIAVICTINSHNKKVKEEKNQGYSFEEIKDVEDISCIDEKILVYTDKNGKVGIMSLDGTVTEEASQDKIYSVSETWGTSVIVCEGPSSEYMLLVDADSGRVTKKQYHGAKKPENIPVWNEEKDCLVWADKEEEKTEKSPAEEVGIKPKVVEVKASELKLKDGMYPITTSLTKGSKYGYMDNFLALKIGFNYDAAKPFSENLGAVKKEGKWGYTDKYGQPVIDCQYDGDETYGAFGFKDGVVPVKSGEKWGLINKKNEAVTAFNLEMIFPGKEGKFVAMKNGKWGVLTLNEDVMAKLKEEAPKTTEQTVNEEEYIVETKGSPLNMRAEANANSDIVARIPNGTTVKISKIFENWAYTTYGTAKGWVSTEYIKKAPNSTVSETASQPT